MIAAIFFARCHECLLPEVIEHMETKDIGSILATLFSELVDGAPERGGAYILNSGDVGLLRSLEKLSASDASRAANDGATIAAHAQHVRYGLSLMNRWAREGGNPFADAKWDEAWRRRAPWSTGPSGTRDPGRPSHRGAQMA